MDHILIKGGYKLEGKIEISGSKNAALPIIASTLLSDKIIELSNIPNLVDVMSMFELLSSLGAKFKKESLISSEKCSIHARDIASSEASYSLVRKMRASFLVLGPLLTREGIAKVSLPGGCAIGTRPVDLHLQAMKCLGATINLEDGYVYAKAPKGGLKGNTINFQSVSVGATENAIMAAVLARGETIIKNAAVEPEIVDLCFFLNSIGAEIANVGEKTLLIQGVQSLNGGRHSVIPDRIEACTYIIAAAITKSKLDITNIHAEHLNNFLKVMNSMGLNYDLYENKICIKPCDKLKSIRIKTEEYPGFSTDMQAQIMTLACLVEGNSEIEENIFENRFMHVPELNRLGAKINIEGNKAIIRGNRKLIGAEVMATDLRASVSLILAGLVAKGETIVNRIYHLDRGYEKIEKKLSNCGAKIKRISNEK